MGVQSFIRGALKSSLHHFDPETVTIGGVSASAVIDTTDSGRDLDIGGDNLPRTIRATFAADAFPAPPKAGAKATTRGRAWKITEVESGLAGLHLTLEEIGKRGG